MMWILAQTPSQDFLDYALDGSIVAIMAIIVIGALREWWVPGTAHRRAISDKEKIIDRLIQERNKALSLNESMNEATRRALDVALASRKDR